MYDSLLDHDLEDETTAVVDVATDIDEKPLDDEDETDSLTETDDADTAEADANDLENSLVQRPFMFAGAFRRRRLADAPRFLCSQIEQTSERLAVRLLGHLREF